MIKKLFFSVILVSSSLTYGQYSQNFEDSSTLTPIVRAGTPEQATAENAANPFKTGINISDTAFKIDLTTGAPAWRWLAINSPGGTYGSTNGTFYKFQFLSGNETIVNIQLEPWFGGNLHRTDVKTVTVTPNTWNEIEFDFSTAVKDSDDTLAGAEPGFLSRIDFKFNATGTYDGDVYYIDNISQELTSTLSAKKFNKTKLSTAYYSTSKDAIIFTDDNNDSFKIYDVLGRSVLAGQIESNINLSSLLSGVYILATDKGTLKFVK